MWVKSLADADRTFGGKAHNLARLLAAGLPVPDGFALAPAARDARDAIPGDVIAEVASRAAALGPSVIARSSATIEDGETGTAAGVFESVPADPAHVWDAIRSVWASAIAPLAVGYARGRSIALGVVIQRRVDGERITVYTRPPSAPGDEIWIQRSSGLAKLARDARDPIAALALRAEAAIGATSGGSDVELIDDRGTLWIVQARPIVRRDPLARTPPPPAIVAPLVADGRVWRWDASHNPAPLSPAQAALVARVDAAGVAPWVMRVCGGYLYVTSREIAARHGHAGLTEIERRLAATLVAPATIDDAIEQYIAFYAIWANELVPAIAGMPHDRDGRSRIGALLQSDRSDDELRAELGDLSPAWDVAVPTYGETWDRVLSARARARQLPTIVERDTALAERDDTWFYRAQAMVRRALLERADELAIDRGDIAWLDPAILAHAIAPDDAKRLASAARAAHARAARWAMPRSIPETTAPRVALHGTGLGPPVTGRVVRVDMLGTMAVCAGDVAVCQTVTPALAVVVIGCAAIVSESVHDGLLDHGVALARELGITCVVGCADAWSRLADGMIVTVDGAAGTVEIA